MHNNNNKKKICTTIKVKRDKGKHGQEKEQKKRQRKG